MYSYSYPFKLNFSFDIVFTQKKEGRSMKKKLNSRQKLILKFISGKNEFNLVKICDVDDDDDGGVVEEMLWIVKIFRVIFQSFNKIHWCLYSVYFLNNIFVSHMRIHNKRFTHQPFQ